MDIVAMIAEQKIREAIERGELDNLPGKGKPLEIEDLSLVPEDLRAGYIILKNAGVLPEEMELKKELVTLERLIESCYDEEERQELKQQLNEKILRFNILMERRKASRHTLRQYRDKIYRRLR
ncbi:MAG: hypothetical protein PWQ31_1018 [Eubacteriales bacterium]|nr:hypothetical protein [Eubacteriales bacterium]